MKTMIATIMDEELIPASLIDETNFDFIQRICALCLDELELSKGFSPLGFGDDVINEIELAVTEVFHVKTYGYYSLSAFRNAQLKRRVS